MSNSKVSYMGVGGIDPIAEKKRVVFRPDTAGDTIRVGDLVCYNHDIAGDYKERATNPIPGDDDTTYSADSQTYNGRLFIVEKPASENLQYFAGVVAALGAGGGVDGDFIDIFIPNGAVVPVMIDQDTTLNQTVVGVRNGVYEGSYPGRPIGIAMETATGNTTDTLCWVKVDPNMFLFQEGDDSRLLIDDEASGSDVTLNKIKVTSAQTTGSTNVLSIVLDTVNTDGGSAMYWEYGNTGTGAGGMKLINAYVEAAGTAIAADVVGMKMQVNLLAGSGSTNAATVMAIFAKVHVKASTGTHSGAVCAARFSLGLDTAVTGIVAQLEFEHTGSQTPDYLFDAIYASSIAATEFAVANSYVGAFDGDAIVYQIKVRIGGNDVYLLAGTPAVTAD